ncbi:hypothetical protein H696_03718 [Fonticula alba]|uniref:Uncharacterized protein n=1 Tax=Fonticula alba TaxID=691883 RepID=A0A058Z4R9_FONAL|nr:hypothetical protein H696_03718 [Fonticula alba]KCV69284.1 hypothetical protein H696_03718 [Fonticula alba]|eukprot:XP_009495849.1 hypothetical protein H696_03718 [Fonticula alba]
MPPRHAPPEVLSPRIAPEPESEISSGDDSSEFDDANSEPLALAPELPTLTLTQITLPPGEAKPTPPKRPRVGDGGITLPSRMSQLHRLMTSAAELDSAGAAATAAAAAAIAVDAPAEDRVALIADLAKRQEPRRGRPGLGLPGTGSLGPPGRVPTPGRSSGRRRKERSGRRRIGEIPAHMTDIMGQANLAYINNDFQKATLLLWQVIREAPQALSPYQTLGSISDAQNDPARALQFYLIAAHLSRRDPDMWRRVGIMSYEQGQADQALYCFSRTLGLRPKDPDALWYRAQLQAERGDPRRAIESYRQLIDSLEEHRRALEALPSIEALSQLGGARRSKIAGDGRLAGGPGGRASGYGPYHGSDDEEDQDEKEVTAAAAAAAAAAVSIPAGSELLVARELVRLYTKTNQLPAAVRQYEAAFVTQRQRAATRYTLEDHQQRMVLLTQLGLGDFESEPMPAPVELNLSDANMLCELYIMLRRFSRVVRIIEMFALPYAQAEIRAERSLAGDTSPGPDPGDLSVLPLELLVKLAQAKIKLHKPQEATAILDMVKLDNFSTYSDIYLEIADAYFDLSLWSKAEAIYEQILEIDQYDSVPVWLRLAYCHLNANNAPRAIELYEDALRVEPMRMQLHLILARLKDSVASGAGIPDGRPLRQDIIDAAAMNWRSTGSQLASEGDSSTGGPGSGAGGDHGPGGAASSHAGPRARRAALLNCYSTPISPAQQRSVAAASALLGECYRRVLRAHGTLESGSVAGSRVGADIGDPTGAGQWTNAPRDPAAFLAACDRLFDRLREAALEFDPHAPEDSRAGLSHQLSAGSGTGPGEALSQRHLSRLADGGIPGEMWLRLTAQYMDCQLRAGRPDRALHAVQLLEASNVLGRTPGRQQRLRLLQLAAGVWAGDLRFALDSTRWFFSGKEAERPRVEAAVNLWHVACAAGPTAARTLSDTVVFRFVQRLLQSELSRDRTPALHLMAGHQMLAKRSLGLALMYYTQALTIRPHLPLTNLCLAVVLLERSMQRIATNRHMLLLQAFTFFYRYAELRTRSGTLGPPGDGLPTPGQEAQPEHAPAPQSPQDPGPMATLAAPGLGGTPPMAGAPPAMPDMPAILARSFDRQLDMLLPDDSAGLGSSAVVRSQEAFYNLGRAYQHVGLNYLAIPCYLRALGLSSEYERVQYDSDLRYEAAYNLHLIYVHQGNWAQAATIMDQYLVI